MTRLRDHADDFAGAIDNAARELRLAAEFVEKDYWVTQALRALHRRYAGWFVLKGGTSLANGYNLIERFSEDVDVLVSPATGDSAKSRERLLLAMVEGVATEMGVEWTAARDPGRGTSAHRVDVLVYPRLPRRGTIVVPIEDRGVLLETGFAGGNWPNEMVEITPILCGRALRSPLLRHLSAARPRTDEGSSRGPQGVRPDHVRDGADLRAALRHLAAAPRRRLRTERRFRTDRWFGSVQMADRPVPRLGWTSTGESDRLMAQLRQGAEACREI